MSNTFSVLMTNILTGGLDVLREECLLARVCPKDFRNVSAQPGSTFSVARPVAQTVGSVTPASTPPALTDNTPTEVTGTLDQWKATRFHVTSKEAAEMKDPAVFTSMQAAEAARSLAYSVNAYMFGLYKKIYGYAGTAGTNPFASTINSAADVREILNGQFCPEGNRFLVLNYAAETAALKLGQLTQAYQRGNDVTLNKGEIGQVMGMNWYRDGQVPSHTAGTITTGLINKAATAVAVGATTLVATTAASTGACALLEGDIILIAGDTQTYVLTAAATQASAASDVTLTFQPPLKVALTGSEAITVKATHRVNLAFDPAAFAMGMRPLAGSIDGAPQYGQSMVMQDPKTGIPLKLTYLPGYHSAQWEFSLLYGGVVADPRRAARLAG